MPTRSMLIPVTDEIRTDNGETPLGVGIYAESLERTGRVCEIRERTERQQLLRADG